MMMMIIIIIIIIIVFNQFQFLLLTHRVNSEMADYINIIIYRNKLTKDNKQDTNEKTTNIKEKH